MIRQDLSHPLDQCFVVGHRVIVQGVVGAESVAFDSCGSSGA
jgi:hypothetical protein